MSLLNAGTILVLGDPLVAAATIAAPLRERTGGQFDVVEHDWDVDLERAVAINRLVEQEGPTAGDVSLTSTEDADAVVGVVTQFHPLPATTLARWPNLAFVATLRAGTENIDTAELARRDIPLVDNAGRNANAVAEFAVAAMLGTLRRLGENHHSVRTGGWRPEPPAEGYRELAGTTVGLVGFGAIGSLVARRLSGFDVHLLVHDPWADLSGRTDLVPVELDDLLSRADAVSMHARLTPQTRGLIDRDRLARMRPDAILVNTARAELVVEDALVDCLREGRLAGAALDVFSVEPLPADHILRTLPQVLLSPHLAGATEETRLRAPELLADRIGARLGGVFARLPQPSDSC